MDLPLWDVEGEERKRRIFAHVRSWPHPIGNVDKLRHMPQVRNSSCLPI